MWVCSFFIFLHRVFNIILRLLSMDKRSSARCAFYSGSVRALTLDHDFRTKPVMGGGPTGVLAIGAVGSTPMGVVTSEGL